MSMPSLSRRAALAQVAGSILVAPSLAFAQTQEVQEHLDLAYYNGPGADPHRHKLNLLVPKSAAATPVLMWIPGGAWSTGSRSAETGVARRLARAGVAAAAIDHRMSPDPGPEKPQPPGAVHPEHVTDCARAAAWIIANAQRYNLDPRNVFVGGFSSGAHLAALLAMDDSYLADVDVSRSQIRAAIPVSGAYDLVRYYQSNIENMGQAFADRHVLRVFGGRENLRPASPSAYLGQASIPMLMISDRNTHLYSQWFEEDVKAARLTKLISFRNFANHTHGSLFLELRDQENSEVRDAIVGFINSMRR